MFLAAGAVLKMGFSLNKCPAFQTFFQNWSRVSSRNEFFASRDETSCTSFFHYFQNFSKTLLPKLAKTKIAKKRVFLRKNAIFCENQGRNEFSRVATSSEKARKTRSDPNFCKTAITETRENENFGKSRLSQGLTHRVGGLK